MIELSPAEAFISGIFVGFVGTVAVMMLFTVAIGFIDNRPYNRRGPGRFNRDEEENGGEA